MRFEITHYVSKMNIYLFILFNLSSSVTNKNILEVVQRSFFLTSNVIIKIISIIIINFIIINGKPSKFNLLRKTIIFRFNMLGCLICREVE
jgi:hypothetical protein